MVTRVSFLSRWAAVVGLLVLAHREGLLCVKLAVVGVVQLQIHADDRDHVALAVDHAVAHFGVVRERAG